MTKVLTITYHRQGRRHRRTCLLFGMGQWEFDLRLPYYMRWLRRLVRR